MIRSKNTIVKVGSYVIVGFFTILIIISFGLPDYITRINMGENTVAKVNGHSITRFDYVRYVNSSPYFSQNAELAKQYRFYIINQLVNTELLAQLAKSLGVSVDPKIVKKMVQRRFTDPSGTFQSEAFTNTLKTNAMSPNDYFEATEKDIMRRELQLMATSAAGISSSELQFRKRIDLSSFVIKYALLTNEEIKVKYADRLAVSSSEVDKIYDESVAAQKEAAKKGEAKLVPFSKDKPQADAVPAKPDPEKEKQKIRNQLESRKLAEVRESIAGEITSLAQQGVPFENGAHLVPAAPLLSKQFKPGDYVYSDTEEPAALHGLEGSDVFLEDIVRLPEGTLARGIASASGVYMFTVVSRSIPQSADVDTAFTDEQRAKKVDMLLQVVLEPFSKKSSITRNEIELD